MQGTLGYYMNFNTLLSSILVCLGWIIALFGSLSPILFPHKLNEPVLVIRSTICIFVGVILIITGMYY